MNSGGLLIRCQDRASKQAGRALQGYILARSRAGELLKAVKICQMESRSGTRIRIRTRNEYPYGQLIDWWRLSLGTLIGNAHHRERQSNEDQCGLNIRQIRIKMLSIQILPHSRVRHRKRRYDD